MAVQNIYPLSPVEDLPDKVTGFKVERDSGPDAELIWDDTEVDWFVTDEHGEKVVRGDRGNTTIDSTDYLVTEADGETQLLVNSSDEIRFNRSFELVETSSIGLVRADWNPNDDRLAVGYGFFATNGESEIYDSDLNFIKTLDDPIGDVNSISWNESGDRLAVGSKDDNVYIYNTNLDLELTLSDSSNRIDTVDFNPNDGRLAVGSGDTNVYIYEENSSTGLLELVNTLTEASETAASLSWDPVTSRLAVSTVNKTRVYSSDLSTVEKTLSNFGYTDWDYVSGRLALGLNNLYVYDENLNLVDTLTDASNTITDVDWNSNNSKLAASSEDNNTYVYDSSLSLISTFTEAGSKVVSVSWSNIELNKLVTVDANANVRLYEVLRNKLNLAGSSIPEETYETTVVNNGTGIVEINEGGSNTITSTVGNAPRLIDEDAEARIRKVGTDTFLVTGDIYKEDGTQFKKEI